jgi:hypothetical protein
MMKRLSFHFLFVFLLIPGGAVAFELYRAGARSVALGNTGVAFTGAEALFHNPAGCAGTDKFTFILSSESRFLMKELSVLAAGMIFPTKAGSAGLSHIRFSAGVYHTGRTTVSFSRRFGERISGAVAFNSLSERFPEQERAAPAITAETGIQIRLNSRCIAGVWVFHPVPFKNSTITRPSLTTLLRAGTCWTLNNGICLLDEIGYSPGEKPVISAGVEINLYPGIALRIGWSSRPMNLSGGVGFKLGKMAIDFSFYHHGYLGLTPVAGFTFNP